MRQFRWIDHRPLLCPIAVSLTVFQLASIAQGIPVFHATRLQIPEGVFYASFDGLSEQGDVYCETFALQPGPQPFDGRAVRYAPDGSMGWDRAAYSPGLPGFSVVGATNGGVFFGDFLELVPGPPAPFDPSLSGGYASTLTEPDRYEIARGRPAGGSQVFTRGASASGRWLCGDQHFYDNNGQVGIIIGPEKSFTLTGSFFPHAINDSGMAVGIDGSTNQPAMWTPAGGVVPLPELPFDSLFASGEVVTNSGLVSVNVAVDASDPTITRQLIFDGKAYEQLDQPGERSTVLHMNEAGWATGYVLPFGEDSAEARIASVWIAGKRYDLNDLADSVGIHLETASAINNQNQLVVQGTGSDGEVVAYLLTPIVPEPTAIAVILASIPFSRRRR